MNQILTSLAPKYLLIKFVYIIASKCTEGFPDCNCPAILLYKKGALVKQIIPALKSLGGKHMCVVCMHIMQL